MGFESILIIFSKLGYIGVFLASLLGTSSIFFPIPYISIIFLVSVVPGINLYLLVFFSSLGATLGEFVSYLVGYGATRLSEKIKKREKKKKKFERWEKFFRKYGSLLIFIFAATPLPDDLIALLMGSIRYNKYKFLFVTFLGKLALTSFVALSGSLLVEKLF